MAIFHLNAKTLGRSQGRSATGAAAYRAGVRIVDERTGLVFDYTRKRGVDGAEILTPDGSTLEREELWNLVERAEVRIDSQSCREVEIALPRELTAEQMRQTVRGFVREQFVAEGMIADIAFHHLSGSNPHSHILLTMRQWQGGSFGLKRRDWNDRALCQRWREQWAAHANAALEQAGHMSRIDHRTLIEQAATALEEQRHDDAAALDRAPTIHERGSPSAAAHNAAVGQANAARLAEWEAIKQDTRRVGGLMPPASDERPRAAADLAAQDLKFTEAMRVSTGPKALRWRFHDDQAAAATAWLTRKSGGDARRLAAREAAALELRLARIAWEQWRGAHPPPFWPWNWPRWRREEAEARTAYAAARQVERRAARRASPEAIEAWRRLYAAKQAEQAAAIAARRRQALLPSEQVHERREQRERRRQAKDRTQAEPWTRQVEAAARPRPRPRKRAR